MKQWCLRQDTTYTEDHLISSNVIFKLAMNQIKRIRNHLSSITLYAN